MIPALIREPLVRYHHRAVYLPRIERVTRALAEHVGRAASLLDVGAGGGEIARAVADRVGATRVRGVDVKIRPDSAIPVEPYDGEHLPAADGEFEVVTISDVLHHCPRPEVVLGECLRVASRLVVIKDHFAFGPVSRRILLWMDVAGNEGAGVHVEGTYWNFAEWTSLIDQAGGRVARLTWPLRIHAAPFRWVARSEYQFVASVERR